MQEEWRSVPGYPDYLVSNRGRVARIRALELNSANGYYSTNVLPNTKRRGGGRRPANRMTVHELVALAFIGPRPTNALIRHIDGNRRNNAATNLIYGNKADNAEDARGHGTLAVGSRVGSAKITEAVVAEIARRAPTERYSKLAAEYGITVSNISAIMRGRAWGHLGLALPLEIAPRHVPKKLTEDNVKAILLRRKEGRIALAEEFGVSAGMIGHIIAGRMWRHVPRP